MASYTTAAPGVYVETLPSPAPTIAGAGTNTAGFVGAVPDNLPLPTPVGPTPAGYGNVATPVNTPVLCTTFTDFTNAFGGSLGNGQYTPYSYDVDQTNLCQAVKGFFNNGGTRCYVARVQPVAGETTGSSSSSTSLGYAEPDISTSLAAFEAIDDIALVLAPGFSSEFTYNYLLAHVEHNTDNRFAIMDTARDQDDYRSSLAAGTNSVLRATDSNFALYFPWLQVADPLNSSTGGTLMVPPSGHMAGIYARVDGNRGVWKAPANEQVVGALGLRYAVSPRDQGPMNANGVNVIRKIGGNILVWGARTMGPNPKDGFQYVNVRRTFNYIKQSIGQSTNFAVFEPNAPPLWANITTACTGFLRGLWQAGGLFGASPDQAFYVKCNAETNPPASRELGLVVTEIGVAIVRPAEFVVFRIGQLAAAS